MSYYATTPLLTPTFTLKRKTEAWFFLTNVAGAPDAAPGSPIQLSATQGRNAGAATVTLAATAYNFASGASLGACTVAFTAAGQIKVTVPASYFAPGPNYMPGQGVYVEVLLSDSTDASPAPQACFTALGLEAGY